MARRKPVPRFDYEYLSGLQSPDAPREIFVLDEAAQQVLSQLAEVVLWRTRWDNASEEDADFVQFRGSIYEALKVPLHFDDLIPHVDDIEALLRQLIASQCCPEGGTPQGIPWDGEFVANEEDYEEPPNVQPLVELPPGWENHPENPGDGSWDELYMIALCDQINRLANAIGDTFRRWSTITNFDVWAFARELVSLIVSRLWPSQLLSLTIWLWDTYYSALDALSDWLSSLVGLNAGAVMADIYASWQATEKDAFVCAVFTAGDADDAAAAGRGVLQGLHEGTAWSSFWALFPLRWLVRRMFDMEGGYEGPYQSNCLDCDDPNWEFNHTFTFDADFENWGISQAVAWQQGGFVRVAGGLNNGILFLRHLGHDATVTAPTRPYTIVPQRLEMDIRLGATWDWPSDSIRVELWSSGMVAQTLVIDTSNRLGLTIGDWARVTVPLGVDMTVRSEEDDILIRYIVLGGSSAETFIDNIKWAGDYL